MSAQFRETSYNLTPIPIEHNVISIRLGHMRKEDDEKIIKSFDSIKGKVESNVSNVMSWHSGWDSHIKYRSILKDLISDIVTVISAEHFQNIITSGPKYVPLEQISLMDSWVSIQENSEEYVREHHHGLGNSFSFCYYLKMEENSSSFDLHSYIKTSMIGQILQNKTSIFPSSGTLLLFPSHLMHSVSPGIGKRYTYSGNIQFDLNTTHKVVLSEYKGTPK